MDFSQWLLTASLGCLVVTKLADLWTTIRHVGQHGESNPLARSLFRRLGYRGGLAVVMGIWCLIVLLVFVPAWRAPVWLQSLTAVVGMIVAWVQWNVARFNATRRSNRVTRITVRVYGRWASMATAWRLRRR